MKLINKIFIIMLCLFSINARAGNGALFTELEKVMPYVAFGFILFCVVGIGVIILLFYGIISLFNRADSKKKAHN